MIEALSGVATGDLTIVLARIIRGQRWLYSIGLLALPGLYAFFALQAGDQAVAVKEMIYGVPSTSQTCLRKYFSRFRSNAQADVRHTEH